MKFKKNNYQFWHSPLALILLLALFLYFGYKIIDLRKIEKETTFKKELVLDDINSLKKRESDLTTNIAELQTDQGKEEVIRDKYQVAKPDEKMVIIVDKAEVDNYVPKPEKIDHSFWGFVRKIFKF